MFDKRGELYLLHYYLNHTNPFGCKGLGMRSMLCTCSIAASPTPDLCGGDDIAVLCRFQLGMLISAHWARYFYTSTSQA